MGDIADMMLDGTLCAGCGVYIGEDYRGIPVYCAECARDQKKADTGNPERFKPVKARKVSCPICGKYVKEVGLRDHTRDAHGEP